MRHSGSDCCWIKHSEKISCGLTPRGQLWNTPGVFYSIRFFTGNFKSKLVWIKKGFLHFGMRVTAGLNKVVCSPINIHKQQPQATNAFRNKAESCRRMRRIFRCFCSSCSSCSSPVLVHLTAPALMTHYFSPVLNAGSISIVSLLPDRVSCKLSLNTTNLKESKSILWETYCSAEVWWRYRVWETKARPGQTRFWLGSVRTCRTFPQRSMLGDYRCS